jgi:hypothetical protein
MKGLEPSTFCMASRRSSQLSYIRGRPEYSPRRGPDSERRRGGCENPRMADEQRGDRDNPVERRPRTPVHRPEDAGTPDRPRPRPRGPGRRFLFIVLGLLALNYLTVAVLAPGEEKAVRVPYSPFFLD